MYHLLIQLWTLAGCTCCWKIKEWRENTDEGRARRGTKEIKARDYRRAAGCRVMGWHEGQSRGNRPVTFNDVFSVEASLCLCSATEERDRGCVSRVSGKHCFVHKHTAPMNWCRSLNMPNKSLHNKLPTNEWEEKHPHDAPLCAHGDRTNCAVSVQLTNTRPIVAVCTVYQWLANNLPNLRLSM